MLWHKAHTVHKHYSPQYEPPVLCPHLSRTAFFHKCAHAQTFHLLKFYQSDNEVIIMDLNGQDKKKILLDATECDYFSLMFIVVVCWWQFSVHSQCAHFESITVCTNMAMHHTQNRQMQHAFYGHFE